MCKNGCVDVVSMMNGLDELIVLFSLLSVYCI